MCFNSSVVRLLETIIAMCDVPFVCFNSSVVRLLEVLKKEIAARLWEFQFQCGAIVSGIVRFD